MNAEQHFERFFSNTKKVNMDINNFQLMIQIQKETLETKKYFEDNNVKIEGNDLEKVVNDCLSCLEENIKMIVKVKTSDLIIRYLKAFKPLLQKCSEKPVVESLSFIDGLYSFYIFERDELKKEYGSHFIEDIRLKEYEDLVKESLTQIKSGLMPTFLC